MRNGSSGISDAPPSTSALVRWMLGVAALVFLMVVVGGITRLTESGLSITEWKPITGAVPPLSEQAWQLEFKKYQQIPEYLEINDREEFKRDVESILREYIRKDREITEAAKDILEARGLPYSDLFRTKRQLAEREDFAIGDESISWIANQLIELFMRSAFVEEVYADDATLRRTLKELLRRNMQADDDLDREVRRHLKHLNEGTNSFEIEYQKQLEAIKRKHGLQ